MLELANNLLCIAYTDMALAKEQANKLSRSERISLLTFAGTSVIISKEQAELLLEICSN